MDDYDKRYDQPSFLERVREQLRYWPYTLHQIDDTLDISLIEGRGKQLLYRAIHSQNLTAFVGSGLSMSYGRLSWRAWEQEQKRVVERNTKLFCDLAIAARDWNRELRRLVQPQAGSAANQTPANIKDLGQEYRDARDLIHTQNGIDQRHRHAVWQWLRTKDKAIEHAYDQVQRLHVTFDLTQQHGGRFPGGEELPVKFEIAQQLHNQLKEFTGLFLPPLPTRLDEDARKELVWAGAYAPERTSAPPNGIAKLRDFCEGNSGPNAGIMTVIGPAQKKFEEAFRDFDAALIRPESHLSFEDLAKALLIDECPHALILLRQGLLRGRDPDTEQDGVDVHDRQKLQNLEQQLQVFDRSNQRRDIEGIRDFPERYQILSPFKFDRFAVLCAAAISELPADSPWQDFWHVTGQRLANYLKDVEKSGDKRTYLTPSSRFLVSVALALRNHPFDTLKIPLEQNWDASKNPFFAKPDIQDFTSRRSIMADRFDPLNKIERDLGIRNFITTNYDFEIERYFVDQGYRTFEPEQDDEGEEGQATRASDEDSFRSDNIGRILKDQTFAPTSASDLTSFGLVDNSSGANVFHLHGRATEDGNLVITENDYMKLYLTQDENRDTVDEGISIAFSGAPLLFLGLGMEETDLLRPLRQFISNRDRTVGYTSIALLPADRGMAARAKFSAALFLRYGVHTVFYGSGMIKIDGHARGIDWLHRMIALKGAMRDLADDWAKNEKESAEAIVTHLYDKVGEIGSDLARKTVLSSDGKNVVTPAYPNETEALNVLLGVPETGRIGDLAKRILAADKYESWGENKEAVRLKSCAFTPVRPRGNPALPHQNEADVTIDGDRFLGFYTALLSELLRITLRLPKMTPEERAATLKPLVLALDGVHEALITGALNAALEGIAKGKQKWWRDWQESPPSRLAQAQRLEPPAVASAAQYKNITAGPDDAIKVGTAFVRHRVDNVITVLDNSQQVTVTPEALLDEQAIEKERPARLAPAFRTRIRAYDTFVAAVACTMRQRSTEDARRRQIITVAARRGLGKGTFMSAASSSLGMQTYKAAAWPQGDVFVAGSIFVNFGFSPEIGSAYDMLTNALIDVIALLEDMQRPRRPASLDRTSSKKVGERLTSPEKTSRKHQKDARKKLSDEISQVSRLTAFRMLFTKLKESADKIRNRHGHARMLITIASVDLLFDDGLRAKNGEIDRFIALLFSDDLADCPIDLLFLADDTNLGAPWNLPPGTESAEEGPRTHRRIRLDRAFLPELAEEQIQRSIRTGQIEIDEERADWRERQSKVEESLGKAPQQKVRDVIGEEKPEPHYIHFTRPMNAISLLVDNFPVLATALYLLNPPGEVAVGPDEDKDCWDMLSEAMREGREASDEKMTKIWAKPMLPTREKLADARGLVAKKVKDALGELIIEHARTVKLRDSESGDFRTALRDRLRPDANTRGSDEWRQVRRSLGNSRFCVTMLLSAAETVLIHSQGGEKAAEEAQQFIRDIVWRVHSIGQERRDQMVLDSVLAAYRRLHVIGDPDLDCEFHFLILRHLAVIGTPVGSALLVRMAEFRDYFDRIGIELQVSRRRFLVRALTVLAYRGLVFRLEPHPRLVFLNARHDDVVWKAEEEYRYSLHRVVQNFALRNLEAGTTDPVRGNSFAPSLYAVMPASRSQLSPTTHVFLRSLMIGLSQYPDISSHDTSADPWLFTTRDTSVRVQALRAAMTLARSTLSVAAVSRMASHRPIGEGVQKRGLLETYRVRLRWIIRMAWEISDEARHQQEMEKGLREPGQQDQDENRPETIRALYRDEIVWLYNELGVISLAQGSLSDALGYLRQAAEQNETIEGRSRNAPIFNHIDLNHGIVQLERGNFKSARTRLDRVFDATEGRKWKVYWAAEGYRCVLDHLIGRREGVAERFRKVSRFFQEVNENRAAGLFLMHQGRFLAEEDPKDAVRLLKRGRELSETDGHEDIRHHIELAQIRLRLRPDAVEPLNQSEVKILQEVESFGRRTSIWSLQADALWLRANLLLRQGETSSAGRLLTRSMAISRRNGMTLRLNSGMTSYAEILLLRGDVVGARKMAYQSLDLAKRIGYSLETTRAQTVLAKCKR